MFNIDKIDVCPSESAHACVLTGTSGVASDASTTIAITLDRSSWLPLEIVWRRKANEALCRYIASHHVSLDGVVTPRCISISRPRERYISTMRLCSVAYHLEMKPAIFGVEALADLQQSVFDEWLKAARAVAPVQWIQASC
jgi:hypothetical protein